MIAPQVHDYTDDVAPLPGLVKNPAAAWIERASHVTVQRLQDKVRPAQNMRNCIRPLLTLNPPTLGVGFSSAWSSPSGKCVRVILPTSPGTVGTVIARSQERIARATIAASGGGPDFGIMRSSASCLTGLWSRYYSDGEVLEAARLKSSNRRRKSPTYRKPRPRCVGT